jgi:hypothetical protein
MALLQPDSERPANLRCRSCGAPIFWGRTALGRAVPLNAEPVSGLESGHYAVSWPDDGKGDALAIHRAAIHLTHFATCPNAASHRKPRDAA